MNLQEALLSDEVKGFIGGMVDERLRVRESASARAGAVPVLSDVGSLRHRVEALRAEDEQAQEAARERLEARAEGIREVSRRAPGAGSPRWEPVPAMAERAPSMSVLEARAQRREAEHEARVAARGDTRSWRARVLEQVLRQGGRSEVTESGEMVVHSSGRVLESAAAELHDAVAAGEKSAAMAKYHALCRREAA